jgi:calcineurin-like phosphoesterase family protein
MTVWFTSDTHYGHQRVITYAKRPFANVQEMNEALITRWNDLVKASDTVYHLGDFALCHATNAITIARRLRGFKHLIWGNHDHRIRRDLVFAGCWASTKDLTEIRIDRQKITLCHYAMRTWASAHHGAWQLYGHSHGNLPPLPNTYTMDVGVDCWDYAPVPFETIRTIMCRVEVERGFYSHDSRTTT